MAGGAAITGLKVLLAEDDSTSKLVTARMLELSGNQLQAVENGEQVLVKLREEHFDLVLMDVQMPVLDGVETTKAIRLGKVGESNKEIPIIATTAYAMAGDKEKFIQAGMNDHLTKPLEITALQTVLSRVMEKGESA